jgi:phospholipase C
MDDNGFPGGEKLGLDKETIWNVFPYKWNTTADYLEAAGVSWFVYQPNRK